MATSSAAALVYGTSQPSLATNTFFLCSPKPFSYHNRIQSLRSSTDYLRSLSRSVPICVIDLPVSLNLLRRPSKSIMSSDFQNQGDISSIFESGFALSMVVVVASATVFMTGAASAAEIPLLGSSSLQLQEPSNALSLPTWAIHVSSVVEWITAMILVWQYGEKSGFQSWKGLSWGMVPLLGGAFCACTWHFFYNSESLEILVALQAALTVIGNFTMCIAAFRIYKASQEGSENV